ncbi:hypothetical protein [Desulforhabdus amnigena]|nr:hypothetical protein [Desulforhabdus amnigena]
MSAQQINHSFDHLPEPEKQNLNWLLNIDRFLDLKIYGLVARNILAQKHFSKAKNRVIDLGDFGPFGRPTIAVCEHAR